MRRGKCDPKLLGVFFAQSGKTPKELAEATEIPLSCILGYLSGKRDAVSTRNMLLIARFFDMSMSKLVDCLSGACAIEIKSLE